MMYIGKKKKIQKSKKKGEHSDKAVTKMTSHSLDNAKDGEPLIVALFYGNLPGLFGL